MRSWLSTKAPAPSSRPVECEAALWYLTRRSFGTTANSDDGHDVSAGDAPGFGAEPDPDTLGEPVFVAGT